LLNLQVCRSGLGNRNEEYFIIILLSIVSSDSRTVHPVVLERGYVRRRIFIGIGVRDAAPKTSPANSFFNSIGSTTANSSVYFAILLL
jgi:hypothetical protein